MSKRSRLWLVPWPSPSCSPPVAAAAPATASPSPAAAAAAPPVGKVGVIPPDSGLLGPLGDRGPQYLTDAFTAAGVEADIQNAQGDKAKFATLCDQMINEGVAALMIVNLDSETGAACETKAANQGIKTIDYDRLTLGGGATYYVSFDNVAVGTAQGEGLVKGMQANGNKTGGVVLLNGSPTDNNATLFKQGYGCHQGRRLHHRGRR